MTNGGQSRAEGPVMVTGGNGAIGRFVVAELAARGMQSVVISRSGDWRFADLAQPISVAGDIRDLAALMSVIERHGVTRIIHMAAFLLGCEGNPLLGFETNACGTAVVLEAARRSPQLGRVVFASTKAAFGPLNGEWGYPVYRPVAEDHPLRPSMTYGMSKKVAEDIAGHYRDHYGVDVLTVRFGTTCGPGKGEGHGAAAITSTMIENAVDGKPTVVKQGGDERDDIIYNRDIAHGLVLAALAPEPRHAVYHLASGELITLHDLAAAIREHMPGARITIGGGLDYMDLGMGNYCLMATERAREDLGFRPRHSLSEWVADYIRIYRASKVAGDPRGC
ncbi:MAG: GDP-mannose 4,6-dehydratase [Alphaproteobacteria bacterium]|nr:MAG: GDP-mannose 4,6-dehydratase [Alphaproteobacteria bacterium]